MTTITAPDIASAFEVFADQANALKMSTYMKDKFSFYGIKAPDRKIVQKEFYPDLKSLSSEESIELAKDLFDLPERELHYFAMDIVDRKCNSLTPHHLEFAEFMILKNSWWDSVDFLATHIFTPILMQLNTDERIRYVHKLSKHSNMWLNRVAIIYQLPLKKDTNQEILELAILPHLDSKEFFLQKAIGWALRQYSKYNPDYVIQFLESHALPKLSIREATKYLS